MSEQLNTEKTQNANEMSCLATQDLSLQSFVQILLLRLERRCSSFEEDDDLRDKH